MEATARHKYAKIDASSLGDNEIIPAREGLKTRVLSFLIISGGVVNAEFRSGSSAISGPLPLAANQVVQAETEWGNFQTATGEALVLNLSAAEQVSGWITYE